MRLCVGSQRSVYAVMECSGAGVQRPKGLSCALAWQVRGRADLFTANKQRAGPHERACGNGECCETKGEAHARGGSRGTRRGGAAAKTAKATARARACMSALVKVRMDGTPKQVRHVPEAM
jgi:hypothetical protein